MESTPIKIDKNLSRLWGLSLICLLLILFAFFNGGSELISSMKKIDILLISLGFLTFVSVFFGFIYYEKGRLFRDLFESQIDSKKDLILKQIEKKAKEKQSSEILDSELEKLKEIESFGGNVKPEKWLKFSIFSFMLTIILSLFNFSIIIPYINLSFGLLTSISFHFGILFVAFLINSIFIWIINYNKSYNENSSKLFKERIKKKNGI